MKEKGRKGRAVEWADLMLGEAALVLGKPVFELPQHLPDLAPVALHLSWLRKEAHWQSLLCTAVQTLGLVEAMCLRLWTSVLQAVYL